MKRLLIGTVALIMLNVSLLSQVEGTDLTLENLLEQLVETQDIEDIDLTYLTEVLLSYEVNKLDLNTATADELSNLFLFTDTEIAAIIGHRSTFGNFIAIEELQTIELLDDSKIKILSKLVSISQTDQNVYNLRSLLNSGTSTLFLKYKRVLQERNGYEKDGNGETAYLGSPNHYYSRYRFDAGRALKAGVTMEKDPGEQFFKESNKYGFDFYSAYIYAEKVTPWLKAINIGDYAVSLGQGLIMHNSFGGNKSALAVDIKKDGSPIRPFSSVNETNFLRGAAVTIAPLPNLSLTLFYSNKNMDASVIGPDTTVIDDFGSVNSLVRDGFHRTASEISKKGTQQQENFGGRLEYRVGRALVGLNHLSYRFKLPIEQNNDLYRKFGFYGNQLDATSIDYTSRYKNLTAFGEVSRSGNGGLAQIHSLLMGLDRSVDVAISYRKYNKEYQTLEANAFGEGSLPINEEAIYFGSEIRFNGSWKVSTYMDLWKNDWLRFRVDQPGPGKEYLVRLDYYKKRKYNAYLQYRYEQKSLNISVPVTNGPEVTYNNSHRLRLHFTYQISKEWELRSRVEGSWFNSEGQWSKGYMIYQDLFYKPIALPFSVNGRIALFDTDNFNNRIYTFENDLLYEFFIPFYQNQGMRTYLNFRYRLLRNMTWEFKIARTLMSDQPTIGSGNELIDGPNRTEFKTQLKYTF